MGIYQTLRGIEFDRMIMQEVGGGVPVDDLYICR
jgi:hypothetical protein